MDVGSLKCVVFLNCLSIQVTSEFKLPAMHALFTRDKKNPVFLVPKTRSTLTSAHVCSSSKLDIYKTQSRFAIFDMPLIMLLMVESFC